jgi:hypothetical protein
MVNKNRPHVLVLPEDRANLDIATGFQLGVNTRQLQVLHEAGGWLQVLHRFETDHISGMERWRDRLMILLIDFDGRLERLNVARDRIPPHLSERVFLLGALYDPQALRSELGNFEMIGKGMARDCRDQTTIFWEHEQLRHNTGELL